MVFLIKIAISR